MDSKENAVITVQAIINAPIAIVWKKWTTPEDIVRWNNAAVNWQTTWAKNDLRAGGKFTSRMEPKDGGAGFDFEGIYDIVNVNEFIAYHLDDGRRVEVAFSSDRDSETNVVENFEAESENTTDVQRAGWQAILDNFKKYVETGH